MFSPLPVLLGFMLQRLLLRGGRLASRAITERGFVRSPQACLSMESFLHSQSMLQIPFRVLSKEKVLLNYIWTSQFNGNICIPTRFKVK